MLLIWSGKVDAGRLRGKRLSIGLGSLIGILALWIIFPSLVQSKGLPPRLAPIRERLVRELIDAKLRKGVYFGKAGKSGHYHLPLGSGLTLVYSLKPCLQQGIKVYLRKARVSYGAFVAVEPKTGRIMALVSYSRHKNITGNLALKAGYPAASIFKLVTAAAALERGKISPQTRIAYRGNPWLLTRSVLKPNRRLDRRVTTFKRALAKSNNVVFARVAIKWVGAKNLLDYAEAFGFNQPIPFESSVEVSRARISSDRYSLARIAAGFQGVTLSPLHGALIAAAIANDGIMMKPTLVDRVVTEQGEVVYRKRFQPWIRAIKSRTAARLRSMMRETITKGTSAKVFRLFRRKTKGRLSIGGKTGTLNGNNPPGRNEWFVGLAPLEAPRIAIAALVIKKNGRRGIKGSQLALKGFKIFFEGKNCQNG
ncbi:MAG: penicillin-binding transpeptidase domain-containing protein [Thermodesulfobacteriota bacterium]